MNYSDRVGTGPKGSFVGVLASVTIDGRCFNNGSQSTNHRVHRDAGKSPESPHSPELDRGNGGMRSWIGKRLSVGLEGGDPKSTRAGSALVVSDFARDLVARICQRKEDG